MYLDVQTRLQTSSGQALVARVTEGSFFEPSPGNVWEKGISQNVVWYVVKTCCERAGLEQIAPRDLRRTCTKLCHSSGELEQIQFLLGHASVQTWVGRSESPSGDRR